MSAIGDYIHLTYTGYVKGPELGSGKPPFFSSYGSAMTNRENHFDAWVAMQQNKSIKEFEKEIQKSLNLLKNFKLNQGNISQVESSDEAMALLNDLWNELDTKYLKVDRIAAAAGGLLNSSGFGSGMNTGKDGANSFRQQMTSSNINSQIQQALNNTLKEITNSINTIVTKENIPLGNISKVVVDTQNAIDIFINGLNKNFKVLDTSSQKQTINQLESIFGNLKTAIQNNENLNANINIAEMLNKLASGLSAGMTAAQYKGDIFEALIAVTARRLAGVAMSSFGDMIESALVTGQSRSSRGIKTSFFSSKVEWEKVLEEKDFKRPFGDKFIVSASAVQDKIDVVIQMENGDNMNISAKNYNTKTLGKGVRNLSASFLALIQNENKNDLINHYLNLNAVSGQGRQSLKPNAVDINNLIRKIVIAKLITGYNTVTGEKTTMSSANVFAVVNSDTYTVKLYNMGDVLQSIFNGNRYKLMYIPTFFYKANAITPDYHTRLNNVMKQINVAVSYTLKESEYAK